MGNSASSLPYSIEEKSGETADGCWDVHRGCEKSTGNSVTVFQAQKPKLAKEGFRGASSDLHKIFVAHHHYQTCKKLRHPCVLQVLASLDTDSPSDETAVTNTQAMATTGAYIIVTEAGKPLPEWLAEDNPNQDQLAWGLQCIIQALDFVHTNAQLAHGNLSPESFWVTPSGTVKLWNFSLATPIGVTAGGGGPTPHFRSYEGVLTPQAYRSPERVNSQWDAIAISPLHCMDSHAMGVLIHDYYGGNIPQKLRKAVQRLQTPSLKMRPRLGPLLKCPVFDTAYAKLNAELEQIQVQPVEEKLRFWQVLDMETIDPNVAMHKVMPIVHNTIKTICNSDAMLSQDLYRRELLAVLHPLFYIVENFIREKEQICKVLAPLMQVLFSVKDRSIRGALLGKTQLFAANFSQNELNTLVFEPLCSGFADSSDALRELTLKATAVLVPHLFPTNIEKLSRYLVRLQSDNSPSIRTHSTTMIPQLCPHLSENARQKLLLPAFARGFRDPHSPCRLAALNATVVCQEYFDLEEVASKVLPACMPLALDGDSDVRTQSFQVIDVFIERLKDDHKKKSIGEVSGAVSTAEPKLQPMPASLNQTSATNNNGSYLSGLSGWYSTSSSKPNESSGTASKITTSLAEPKKSNPNVRNSSFASQAKPPPAFSSLSLGGNATTQANDGWGDDDDDLDLGNEAEDVFASIGIGSGNGGKKSGGKLIMSKAKNSSSKKQTVTKLSMDTALDSWDDF